jgi:hypothetical protein
MLRNPILVASRIQKQKQKHDDDTTPAVCVEFMEKNSLSPNFDSDGKSDAVLLSNILGFGEDIDESNVSFLF